MRISIIVPVYNVAEYVIECLDSVASQDFPDLECVVVDDCSTDDSKQKVMQWLSSYEGHIKFQFVCHEQNKGLSASRNTGLKYVTGDYVLYLDSDDYLLPNAVSMLAHGAEQHPGVDYVVASCDSDSKDLEGRWQISESDKGYWDNPNDIQRIVVKNPNVWNKLYRRSLLVENDIEFDESVRMTEDLLYNCLVYRRLRSIYCISSHTCHYRIRPNSILTSTDNDERKLKNFINVCHRLIVQESDNKYNCFRYEIIKALRHLLYARRKQLDFSAWKDYDMVVRKSIVLELKHLRFRNALTLSCFVSPICNILR